MLKSILFISLINLYFHLSTCQNAILDSQKKCESTLGSLFSKNEKKSVCNDVSYSLNQEMRSLCALELRKEFKFKLNEILIFCNGATNLDHLSCLRDLPPSDRVKIGTTLCPINSNFISSKCFKEIKTMNSQFSKNQTDLINFCSNVKDKFKIDCFKDAISATKLQPNIIFSGCGRASAWNNGSMTCISKLKPLLSKTGSFKLAMEDVLNYCLHIHQESDINCLVETLKPNSELFQQNKKLTQILNPSSRILLCYNTPTYEV